MDALALGTTTAANPSMDDTFSEDVFEAMGAGDMSDEEKAALFLQIIEIVQTRVLDKVYEKLTHEQRQELTSLMEEDRVEEVEVYLLQVVPEYYDMFEQEAKQLRRQLVTRMVG